MRVVSLVFAGALSLIAWETPSTFGGAAQIATVAMDGGGAAKPASESPAAANPDPAERSAKSIECAQKADAQGLQGKARRRFLRECKRGS